MLSINQNFEHQHFFLQQETMYTKEEKALVELIC